MSASGNPLKNTVINDAEVKSSPTTIHPDLKTEDLFPNNKLVDDENIQRLQTKLIDEQLHVLRDAPAEVTDIQFTKQYLKEKYEIDIQRESIIRLWQPKAKQFCLYAINEDVLLGRGTFGRVYLAQNLTLDTWHAFKLFIGRYGAESTYDEIQDEANYLTLLKRGHGQIIRTPSSAEEKKSTLYSIMMDYFPGVKANAMFDIYDNIDNNERFDFMFGVLSELKLFQSHNLVHCDINPDNIMYYRQAREVRFVDFGTVQPPGPTGYTKGTMSYAPSEIFDTLSCSFATDIATVGATFCGLWNTKLYEIDISLEVHTELFRLFEKMTAKKSEERANLAEVECEVQRLRQLASQSNNQELKLPVEESKVHINKQLHFYERMYQIGGRNLTAPKELKELNEIDDFCNQRCRTKFESEYHRQDYARECYKIALNVIAHYKLEQITLCELTMVLHYLGTVFPEKEGKLFNRFNKTLEPLLDKPNVYPVSGPYRLFGNDSYTKSAARERNKEIEYVHSCPEVTSTFQLYIPGLVCADLTLSISINSFDESEIHLLFKSAEERNNLVDNLRNVTSRGLGGMPERLFTFRRSMTSEERGVVLYVNLTNNHGFGALHFLSKLYPKENFPADCKSVPVAAGIYACIPKLVSAELIINDKGIPDASNVKLTFQSEYSRNDFLSEVRSYYKTYLNYDNVSYQVNHMLSFVRNEDGSVTIKPKPEFERKSVYQVLSDYFINPGIFTYTDQKVRIRS